MSQKISQSKSYVAIPVPQNSASNIPGKRFSSFFRRNIKTNKASDKSKKSEVARLLSLAKQEKWSLVGK